MLFENVPQNVRHPAGPALEFEITFFSQSQDPGALFSPGDVTISQSGQVARPSRTDSLQLLPRQLASTGHGLIFTTSFGYMDATNAVAAKFPNVMFEHATGYKTDKNVGIYNARFYEGRYVQGVIAAQTIEVGTLVRPATCPHSAAPAALRICSGL